MQRESLISKSRPMHESLYRFLIKYKEIALPGIGTITLRVQPAESEFVNRSFLPPKYSFVFEKGKENSSKKLFSWLSASCHITEREAVIRFNNFVFDWRKGLEAGKKITWTGVGSLRKNLSGEIQFDTASREFAFQEEVIAQKVLRENAEHTMLVGEREKTSTEMTEFLLHPPIIEKKANHWWVWPLAIILMTIMFLGWYFSEKGISGTSTGNNHRISPEEAPASYNLTR